MTSSASYRIAILGAGLLGRVTALVLRQHLAKALNELSQRHNLVQLSVFEQGDFQQPSSALGYQATAGKVAAGMITPLAESVQGDADLVDMGYASIARWPSLLQLLPEPVFFQQSGSILVAHPQDRVELDDFVSKLKAPSAAYQPSHGNIMQWLDGPALAALEPSLLPRFQQGLWLCDDAQLDNQAFFQHSFTALQQANVALYSQAAVELRGNQVWLNKRKLNFDLVLDCRGLGSKPQWRSLRGVRGEVIRVRCPEVHLSRPIRLMHPRYALYIAPKPNHEFVIGATEIESNAQHAATVRSSLELLSALYTVEPAFAEAELLSIQVGSRPTLPDNRPCLRVKPKLLSANGLYRHGYLLAPVMADALLELSKAQLWPAYQAKLAFPQLLKQPSTKPAYVSE